ncbi:SNAP receptor [Blyttiomyces sp. JEL0837]|nr:SNAP receptor [Blyttiomyces sp. JEL0837]
MTKNIQDVLGRGETIDRMSSLSSQLSQQSKKYLKDSKKLHYMALYHKYGPPAVVLAVVLLVLWVRFYWW